jgi:hypothetical protein
MATITSAQTGNFSDTATWVGGVVPTVGDIAVAATGHVIAIDVDVTVTKVTQAGTGKFTLGNGRTLTAEVEANAGTFTSGGTVEVTATSGNTAYIIGNVTGVSSTAVNVCGVNVTGTGTLELTGNVTASAGSAGTEANGHASLYTNVTCTINITGNVTGGTGQDKRGVQVGASSNAIVTIIGSVFGSPLNTGTRGYGLFLQGTSCSATIAGDVTGGGASNANGILLSGASANVTIAGNVTGGTTSNAQGAGSTGAFATITVTGGVIGGSGSAAHGANATGATATVTITGTATGGSGASVYGAHATGTSATITITGDVTGGAGTSAHGAYATGATSLITVTGSATSSSTSSNAIRSDATSSGYGVLFSGDLTDTQSGVVACFARFFRIIDTSPSGVTQYANNASFPTGGTVSRVSADNVTGMPAEANVRDGLTFGYNDELEGTLAMPNSGSVALGVPVDNTTGTAVLTQEAIWNYLASSATTPNSLGAILANIISLLRDDAIDQIITYNRNGNNTLSISGSNDYRTFNINTSAGLDPLISFGDEIL